MAYKTHGNPGFGITDSDDTRSRDISDILNESVGQEINIIKYGAKCDGVVTGSASMTSGQATLTVTGAFAAATVGMLVEVMDAGPQRAQSLHYDGGTTAFVEGGTVTGGSSGATGVVARDFLNDATA